MLIGEKLPHYSYSFSFPLNPAFIDEKLFKYSSLISFIEFGIFIDR